MTPNNYFCRIQKDCCVSGVTEFASAAVGLPLLSVTSIHSIFPSIRTCFAVIAY